MFTELMGVVLDSGDGGVNESFFALTGALDLVEEEGMQYKNSNIRQ